MCVWGGGGGGGEVMCMAFVGKEMTYIHIAGIDKVSLAVCLAFNWPQRNPVVVI